MNYDIGVFTRRRIISPAESYYAVPPAVIAGYTAQGVHFDGSTNYLTRGAGLSGAADGKQGIISFWFRMTGGDGTFQMLLEPDSNSTGVRVLRYNDNTLRMDAYDAGPANIMSGSAASLTFVNGMAWTHSMMAWDLATATAKWYINGVDQTSFGATTNANVDYTRTDWFVGNRNDLSMYFNGDIADLYINFKTTLDLTNSANRLKFYNAGSPVDLGSDGSTPTGVIPTMFFHGAVASWETNDGDGGGFTEHGTLTAAGSNPP